MRNNNNNNNNIRSLAARSLFVFIPWYFMDTVYLRVKTYTTNNKTHIAHKIRKNSGNFRRKRQKCTSAWMFYVCRLLCMNRLLTSKLTNCAVYKYEYDEKRNWNDSVRNLLSNMTQHTALNVCLCVHRCEEIELVHKTIKMCRKWNLRKAIKFIIFKN